MDRLYKFALKRGIFQAILIVIVLQFGDSLNIQQFNFPPDSTIGKRVSVTCTPSSGEKNEFKWYKNGRELSKGLNMDIRSYPDISTLVIDSLTEEDNGNYTCTVSSKGSTASYTTNLQVLVPPSWNHMPRDIDALSGDPVVLNCEGSGTPKPTVIWYRSQGENMEFYAISNLPQLSILSNGSVFLNSIEKEDEGMYKCNVSNGIGSSLVKTIVVRVIGTIIQVVALLIGIALAEALKIIPFSFPIESSIVGKRITATCTTSSGEKMEFKWLKNGKTLSKGLNVDIRSYPDLSTLVIDSLSEEDSGNYTCNVNSRGVTASYTTSLQVLVPPSWSIIPKDIDALSGDPVVLNCEGSGTPKPTVTWFRSQGENIEFTPISNILQPSVLANGSLLINSIGKEHEGLYKCNVSNGIGTSLLKTIVLQVIGNGSFKIQPFTFPSKSIIGERITTTCSTSSNEKMTFKWLKNGREIINTNNIQVRSFPEFSTLILDSLSIEDAGNFTCVASTRGFTESFTTVLEVLGKFIFSLIALLIAYKLVYK
ncbi:hypothetical protein JTE90_019624 [Oedothorax gibbosus]|uniref:Ig-like domain-containing protein n=1 Tax=Oedothorax gibbosus TaxID=931172 RepID=A0AAV6TSP4_9ARAC|nr:hypothetical protein JTE90_019624 [Oedothorax gibbosus]